MSSGAAESLVPRHMLERVREELDAVRVQNVMLARRCAVLARVLEHCIAPDRVIAEQRCDALQEGAQ